MTSGVIAVRELQPAAAGTRLRLASIDILRGAVMVLMAIDGWFTDMLATFGRVPLFYYLLHIPLIFAVRASRFAVRASRFAVRYASAMLIQRFDDSAIRDSAMSDSRSGIHD